MHYIIEQTFCDENKYTKIYISIVNRAIEEKRSKSNSYFERHHILPKSIFPEFKDTKVFKWNIVLLTAREHFIAHYLLWKIYSKKGLVQETSKMALAFMKMRCVNPFQQRVTSKLFEYAKVTYEHTDVTRLKMSKLKQGKVLARDYETNERKLVSKEEFRSSDKLVGITKGMISAIDVETNKPVFVTKAEFESNPDLVGHNKGKIRDDVFKANLSKKNSGAGSSSAKRINIYDANDKLMFECHGNFAKVCKLNRLPTTTLRNTYQFNTKIFYKEGQSMTKARNNGSLKYQGWYARVVS